MAKKRHKALIIVESPAKIKTLMKLLGNEYAYESSIGHIRDLPEKDFGIDIENDFEPKYVTMPDKENVIKALQSAAKKSEMVFLSPDPDREGEAIAWHILQILPEGTKTQRVTFNSLTKKTVLEAIEHPRELDLNLVNAQQARRLLDRIVGYKISPLLNRRLHRGREGFVSAGRVQSIALIFVVDREKEIEAFVPVEYWNLAALLQKMKSEQNLRASLYSVDDKKVVKENPDNKEDLFLIPNKDVADLVLKKMQDTPYSVKSVERKEKRRNPVPPFITSTLQQEASRHFGFSAAKTMNIAQKLYEGIELGPEGGEGLITYMRTDSVRIIPELIHEARGFIEKKYGKQFLPEKPNNYSTKKSAQDAHEAIRPSSLKYDPEKVQKYLTREEFMLYQLIWKRFVSSQMTPAIYDTVSCDIVNTKGIVLRATGSVMKFSGFLAVYEEKSDEEILDKEDQLPDLKEGERLDLLELISEQSFTRPPPRYTEASLVKELEKSGIGRPSTYASIMNKIQGREYTLKEKGRLKPTELGRVIAQMLETNFTEIMDVGFTAAMEDELEKIAESQLDWKKVIRDFWEKFEPTLEKAEKEAFVPKILTDRPCPKCESPLQKVWYRSKYFYGCSKYPDCDYTAAAEELDFDQSDYAEDFNWEQPCPNCGAEMKLRHGRYGAFLGCTKYPECRGIVNIPKKGEIVIPPEDLPECPAIDCTGHITARKSRFGKTFYSCSTFPECDVIVNEISELHRKYVDHPRTPYEKKTKKKGGKGKKTAAKAKKETKKPKKKRVTKSLYLSKELQNLIGESELPRGDVLKKVWDYVKSNDLQDPKDKRIIHPDDKLSKVFGTKEEVGMFSVAGLLSKHMHKEKS
ncbi:MAG: type I DNA topoisomerase [Waddliaceae bacterium]